MIEARNSCMVKERFNFISDCVYTQKMNKFNNNGSSYNRDDKQYSSYNGSSGGGKSYSSGSRYSGGKSDYRKNNNGGRGPRKDNGSYGGSSSYSSGSGNRYSGYKSRDHKNDRNGDKSRNELFSSSLKVGSRRYYFDIKYNRNKEKYLVINESKMSNSQSGYSSTSQSSIQRHRIMVFEEDLSKFSNCFFETITYLLETINKSNPENKEKGEEEIRDIKEKFNTITSKLKTFEKTYSKDYEETVKNDEVS